MSSRNSLTDLLAFGLIRPGDAIHFTFKKHHFCATLEPGGILANCFYDHKPCFMDRAGFNSLTDWCDSCIQELLEEYATRFSGWKRCKHTATGTTMAMLRQRLQTLKPNRKTDAATELAAEQRKVVLLKERIRVLEIQLRPNKRQREPHAADADQNPFRLRL